MKKISFLLCMCLLLACLLLTACVGTPPDEDKTDDTVADDTKLDIIDGAIEVFKRSGTDAINRIMTASPNLERLLGMLVGECEFDKNSLPSVYFSNNVFILDDHSPKGELDVYAIRENTLMEISANRPNDEWTLIKATDLTSDFKDTRSVLGLISSAISSIDLSNVQKSDITYEDECFYISEAYIKASLENALDASVTDDQIRAEISEYTEPLKIKLGFVIKSSKLIGVKAEITAAEINQLDIKQLSLSLDYMLDAASELPYMLSLSINGNNSLGNTISADINLLTLFNAEKNLTGINMIVNAEGNLPILTLSHESGEKMTVSADARLHIDMLLDGAKILSTDGTVLDMTAELSVEDNITFTFFDKDGNRLDAPTAFTEQQLEDAKAAVKGSPFKLCVKAVNTAIKQGNVNITLQKNRVLQETNGKIVYSKSENYPGTEKLESLISGASSSN